MLLGIDVGTTYCKAGVFDAEGRALRQAARPMAAHRAPEGHAYYAAEELWQTVAAVIHEAVGNAGRVEAVGVASMAESGLLVDRSTGRPRTAVLPWYDTAAASHARRLAAAEDEYARFARAGIYPSFKVSLAKLLWLLEDDAGLADNALWLSVADYVVMRLTGVAATDYSLAGRTYAFSVSERRWDEAWLARFGLSASHFPPAQASGQPAGGVSAEAAALTGLPRGTTVAVAGHDHVCAAFAAGAVEPGRVFDSMGTAETLIGALPGAGALGEREFNSGLTYGCHVVADALYWMGGLSTSGGSVEWLRGVLADPPLSYAELESALAEAPDAPTGILYFPYLAGSGAPHTDPGARGAFAGLAAHHSRAHLARAVLEGAAYELDFIRRTAEAVTGAPITTVRAAGGGTRNAAWMQIKADVSGCCYETLAEPEATLQGAALLAGLGAGVIGPAQVAACQARPGSAVYEPRPEQHAAYAELYERGYARLLPRLLAFRLDEAGVTEGVPT